VQWDGVSEEMKFMPTILFYHQCINSGFIAESVGLLATGLFYISVL
jgi:hypothetical protein